MATMDDKALFVDTNVLVYANVIETPMHEKKGSRLTFRLCWNAEIEPGPFSLKVKAAQPPLGGVQLRNDGRENFGDWSVKLFGPAFKVA